MKIPAPGLTSVKGLLVMLIGVAIAVAILTQTRVGTQLQSAVNGVAARVPA
jgi:hypothetical protein